MADKPLPSQEVLRQLLDYDPETGKLTWRKRTATMFGSAKRDPVWVSRAWNNKWAGREAFTNTQSQGYRSGRINGADCLAHRIIWKWWHGTDAEMVDHVNGDKVDNRITNLRSVTQRDNNKNMPLPRHNTSGEIGVGWCKRTGKWEVALMLDRVNRYVGQYHDFDTAIAARDEAMAAFGFHPNHGRKE